MNPKVRVERTESIPRDANVRHYDELASDAKQRFPALADGVPSEAILDDKTASEFTDGEFVIYTGYYQIRVN